MRDGIHILFQCKTAQHSPNKPYSLYFLSSPARWHRSETSRKDKQNFQRRFQFFHFSSSTDLSTLKKLYLRLVKLVHKVFRSDFCPVREENEIPNSWSYFYCRRRLSSVCAKNIPLISQPAGELGLLSF